MPTYTVTLPSGMQSGNHTPFLNALNLATSEYIKTIQRKAISTITWENTGSSTYPSGNDFNVIFSTSSSSYLGDAYLTDIAFTYSGALNPHSTLTNTNISASSIKSISKANSKGKSIYVLFTFSNLSNNYDVYLRTPVDFTIVTDYDPVTITSASSGNGTVTDITGTHAVGDVLNITATPNSGYRFARWEATVGTLGNAYSATTTYTVPSTNATITGYFEISPTVTVTSASGGNGAVSNVSGEKEVGSIISISATPNTGYVFDRWYAQYGDFGDVFSSSTTYTVPNVNVTIIGYFKQVSSNLKAGYYNGSSYDAVIPMYYDGSSWVECEWKRYNGSSWDNADTT